MSSLLKDFGINAHKEIQILYNNLILKEETQLLNCFSNSKFITKSNIYYIYNLIDIYLNQKSFKRTKLARFLNYMNTKITSQNVSYLSSKYKLSKKEEAKKIVILIYLILFHCQISLQKNNNSKLKYYIIKKLYYLNKINSYIISKFYLDKFINISDLENILKILILLSINNNFDIKGHNDIYNIMFEYNKNNFL